jgi:hypothetical protein
VLDDLFRSGAKKTEIAGMCGVHRKSIDRLIVRHGLDQWKPRPISETERQIRAERRERAKAANATFSEAEQEAAAAMIKAAGISPAAEPESDDEDDPEPASVPPPDPDEPLPVPPDLDSGIVALDGAAPAGPAVAELVRPEPAREAGRVTPLPLSAEDRHRRLLRLLSHHVDPCERPTGRPEPAPDIRPEGWLMTEWEYSKLFNGARFADVPLGRDRPLKY